ncbi:alpha/beta fold hydrolase [Streptomyces sp. NBC_00859]|uniref:alpha/beta fold hydrolase n=1 Tax=Streptomyces sp. NBC_00859 TaxID=2903682 RepID=UPI0038672FFF|nr:alpha/beta fold hydrolase [Streptomyces sp. NBC_00859]
MNAKLLAYDTLGNEADPPLLLIQGLGAHLVGWPPGFCRLLADEGFYVVRCDNRDVGLSPRYPEGGYGVGDMADDVAALLRSLGTAPAHVVGQSLGGVIAQHLALRHPGTVRSLGLLYTAATVSHFTGDDLVADRLAAPRPRDRAEFTAAYVAGEAACASTAYEQDIEWLTGLGGLMYDRGHEPASVERQLMAALGAPDLRARLGGITVPTAVVAGDSDRLISPTASAELSDLIAGSTLTVFPGMGHELPAPLWPEIVRRIADNARRTSTTGRSTVVRGQDGKRGSKPAQGAPLDGTTAPGYEAVADAFAAAVASSPRGGCALAVTSGGETVVDLWGGYADVRSRVPWAQPTTSVAFSMTKGLVALLVARLVEEGLVDLDAAVSSYWPEFGQAGKESITVRQVMAHRAGLSHPDRSFTREDVIRWSPVVEALAGQAPHWPPGSAHQYHALTYGWLVGEVVRRVTGMSAGAAFAKYLAGPARADVWIGVPAAELKRIAHVVPGPGFSLVLPDGIPHKEKIERSLTLGGAFPDHAAGDGTGLNDPGIQRAEIPAGVGIGTARGIAALWSAALDGSELTNSVPAAILDDMTAPQSSGRPFWPVEGLPEEAWGTGFHVPSPAMPMLGPTSFGHGGAGGQISFADRDSGLCLALLTNDLQIIDDRVPRLLDAVRACMP